MVIMWLRDEKSRTLRKVVHIATPVIGMMPIIFWKIILTTPNLQLMTRLADGVMYTILSLLGICLGASALFLYRDLLLITRSNVLAIGDVALDAYPVILFVIFLLKWGTYL